MSAWSPMATGPNAVNWGAWGMPYTAPNPVPPGAVPIPENQNRRRQLSRDSDYPSAKPPRRKPNFKTPRPNTVSRFGVGKYGAPVAIGAAAVWGPGPSSTNVVPFPTARNVPGVDAGPETGPATFTFDGERMIAWHASRNYSAIAALTKPDEAARGETAVLYIGPRSYTVVIEKNGRRLRTVRKADAETRLSWVVTGKLEEAKAGRSDSAVLRPGIVSTRDGRPGSKNVWDVTYYRALRSLYRGTPRAGQAQILGRVYSIENTIYEMDGQRLEFRPTLQNVVEGWTGRGGKLLFARGSASQYQGDAENPPMIPFPLEAAPMIRAIADKNYAQTSTQQYTLQTIEA